jgi:WD40 repeat protein
MDTDGRTYLHDAFISYSRKNRDFAARLKKALEDYTPPKDLKVPQRHLDVFRDETDFTGVEYHRSVETHLHTSRKLLVICSPDARKSQFVNDEIRRFAAANDPDNIVPVLVAGVPNNEARPEQEADQAFPDALCEVLEMPLAVNYLSFDSRRDRPNKGPFDGPWYTILANLYGLSRSVIEQRDRRRQARQRRIRRGIVTGVIAALLAALAVTLVSRQDAVKQRVIAQQEQRDAEKAQKEAEAAAEAERKAKVAEEEQRQRADERSKVALSRQLAAEAATERRENRLDFALLLSLEAQRVGVDTLEARSSLLSALEYNPRIVTSLHNDGAVSGISFSPDGRTLAAASGTTITLWDTAAYRRRGRPLLGHGDAVFSVGFSRDGRYLVSGSRFDKNLLIWDVATARPVGAPLRGHDGAVQSVAFSPDGTTFATGGGDGKILVWDVASRQPRGQPLVGHTLNVTSLAFSPDGRRIVSGSWDRTVLLWDAASGQRLRQIGERSSGQVESVAVSPDGRLIASGGGASDVTLWDASTGERVGLPLRGHTNSVKSVAFSPDGKILASAAEDHTVMLWDVASRNSLEAPLTGHTSGVEAVAFNPDGTLLTSGDSDGTIIVWNIERSHRMGRVLVNPAGRVNVIAFSPDGKRLASSDCEKTDKPSYCTGQVRLWDLMSGRQIGTPGSTHHGPILSLTFSQAGRVVMSGSCAKVNGGFCNGIEVRSWDPARRGTGSTVTVDTPWYQLEALAFAPGHHNIVAGGCRGGPGSCDVGEVLFWNFTNRRPPDDPIGALKGLPSDLVFTPDGRLLAMCSLEDVVLWDVEASKPIGPPFTGRKVAFSADGQLIAVFDHRARTVVLRDAATGQPRGQPLTGLPDVVSGLVFSPDGRILASVGSNVQGPDAGAITLWDVATRQPIGEALRGHSHFVRSLAFSPDGLTLASSGDDAKVVLWDMNAASWRTQACRIANRNLTLPEWQKHLGDAPYRATCPDMPVDLQGLIAAGRQLASDGDTTGAARLFRRVRELDSSSRLDPEIEARNVRVLALVERGEYVARSGDVMRAVDLFAAALRLDPQLALNPTTKAGALAAPGVIAQGQRLVKRGDVKDAIAAFARASELDPKMKVPAQACDDLCRFGSVWGHAREVVTFCTTAVALEPRTIPFRESRGLARALTGDAKGAIEDFDAFIAWGSGRLRQRIGLDERQRLEADIAERTWWIGELRDGRNPLTRQVLEKFRKP